MSGYNEIIKEITNLKNAYIERAGIEPNCIYMNSCYYVDLSSVSTEIPSKVFDMNIIIDDTLPSMYVCNSEKYGKKGEEKWDMMK